MDKPLKPGDLAILISLPPGFIDDLPAEDQRAITEIVGKPIAFCGYDEDGRAELEFHEANGTSHNLLVRPEFVRAAK